VSSSLLLQPDLVVERLQTHDHGFSRGVEGWPRNWFFQMTRVGLLISTFSSIRLKSLFAIL
jgi:hypothetical protein